MFSVELAPAVTWNDLREADRGIKPLLALETVDLIIVKSAFLSRF